MTALRVRRARAEDAPGIAEVYAPFVRDTAISFEAEPPTIEEMGLRIADIGAIYPWLVADDGGQIAGYAYGSRHAARAAYRWSADVTVYLAPKYQGRGLGRKLYDVLFPLLERQGIRSLYAGITLPNDASVGLHRAVGMREVGIYRNVGFKHGAWRDVIWLGLSFDDARAPQGPPLPCGALPEIEIRLER